MHKFYRFLFTGIATYIINLGCTYLLKNIFLIDAVYAYAVALCVTTGYNFLFSLYFTFRKHFNFNILMKYIVFLVGFSMINYAVTIGLSNVFGLEYIYLFIFCVTTALFFAKYYAYDRLVFINKKIL